MAGALAREGTKMDQIKSFLCLEVPPVFVSNKLETEKEGTTFVRHSKKAFAINMCNSNVPFPPNTNSRCHVLPLDGNNVMMHIT